MDNLFFHNVTDESAIEEIEPSPLISFQVFPVNCRYLWVFTTECLDTCLFANLIGKATIGCVYREGVSVSESTRYRPTAHRLTPAKSCYCKHTDYVIGSTDCLSIYLWAQY